MHTPDVTTPLSFDLYMEPFIRGFGMLRLCQQNYYVYMHQPAMPPSAPGPVPLEAIHAGARRWREEIIPEVSAFDQHYLTTDFDSMSAEELAAELDRLADARWRCGQLHTMSTLPWGMGMMSLIETVRELTGGSDLAAPKPVQGHPRLRLHGRAAQAGRGAREICLRNDGAARAGPAQSAPSRDRGCGRRCFDSGRPQLLHRSASGRVATASRARCRAPADVGGHAR